MVSDTSAAGLEFGLDRDSLNIHIVLTHLVYGGNQKWYGASSPRLAMLQSFLDVLLSTSA